MSTTGKKVGKSNVAWEEARRFGCDMSLVADNLQHTPGERIRRHTQSLKTAMFLRQAVESRHVRS